MLEKIYRSLKDFRDPLNMNKVFKTVWNASAQCFIAASENAKSHTKSSSAARRATAITTTAIVLAASGNALAVPPVCGGIGITGSCEILSGTNFTNSAGTTITGQVTLDNEADYLFNAGTLTNAGTVVIVNGIANAVAVLSGGTITATGSATPTAVLLTGSTLNELENDGTLTAGYAGYGVRVTNNSTLNDLINTGTLSSGDAGIAISVDTGSTLIQINNSGTISSTNFAIAADGVIGTIGISGTHAVIQGDVYAPSATVQFGSGAGSPALFTVTNSFQVGSFLIDQNAQLVLGTVHSTSGTLNLGIEVTGGVSNSGTLEVPAGQTGKIFGDYTQTSHGTLQLDVASNTSYGKLSVSGTATFPTNAHLALNVTDPSFAFTPAALTGLVTAGTLVTNGFKITDNSTLFNFTAVQNGNSIDLQVVDPNGNNGSGNGSGDGDGDGGNSSGNTGGGGSSTGDSAISVTSIVNDNHNGAARGVGPVLDQFISSFASNGTTGNADMDQVVSALGRLTSTAQVNTAAKQTLPVIAGNQVSGVQSSLDESQSAVSARQNTTSGVSTGDPTLTDRAFWVKPFGSHASQSDVGGAIGFQANTYGIVFGADADVTNLDRLGAAFAYGNSHVNGGDNDAPSTADVDSYQAIFYGTHRIDATTNLNFQADIGYHHTDGDRYIDFGGLNRDANSGFNGYSGHVGAALGRSVSIGGNDTVTPRVSADYTYIRDTGYSETGAGALNLNVGSSSTQALVFRLGTLLDQPINDRLAVSIDAAAGYDALARENLITSNFVGGGAAFTTYGVHPSHWLLDGGIGLHGTIKEGMTISLDYNVEGRDAYLDQSISAKFRMAF
jgi:autotransporter family porin